MTEHPLYAVEDRGHDTPCWIWKKCVNVGGYGRLGSNGSTYLAHRWFYERKHGPVAAAHRPYQQGLAAELSLRYGVSKGCIRSIWCGESWADVEDAA